jgi:hypothetical protein
MSPSSAHRPLPRQKTSHIFYYKARTEQSTFLFSNTNLSDPIWYKTGGWILPSVITGQWAATDASGRIREEWPGFDSLYLYGALSSATHPGRLWNTPSSLLNGYRETRSSESSSRSLRLNTHLHTVSMLKINGAFTSNTPYVFMTQRLTRQVHILLLRNIGLPSQKK